MSKRQSKPASRLSIVAMVFSVLLPPLGFVLGAIAWYRVKLAGDAFDDQLPLIAMVSSVVGVLVLVVFAGVGATVLAALLGFAFNHGRALH